MLFSEVLWLPAVHELLQRSDVGGQKWTKNGTLTWRPRHVLHLPCCAYLYSNSLAKVKRAPVIRTFHGH